MPSKAKNMHQRRIFLGRGGEGSEVRDTAPPSLGNLGAKLSEMSFPHFKTYRKIQKISPSIYKLPKLITQKHLTYIAPPNISPWGLILGNCPQIHKTNKQTNKAKTYSTNYNFLFAKELLCVPKWLQSQSVTVYCCLHSSLFILRLGFFLLIFIFSCKQYSVLYHWRSFTFELSIAFQ